MGSIWVQLVVSSGKRPSAWPKFLRMEPAQTSGAHPFGPNPQAFTRARIEARLSIPELASRANCGRNTLWRIETGRTVPRMETVRRIAEALGRPLVDFYRSHDNRQDAA